MRPIGHKSEMIQIMTSRRKGDKGLSVPMMTYFYSRMYVYQALLIK